MRKMILDLFMLTNYLFFCCLSIIEMDFIINETPSMDNVYNSTYYKQTRDYEQNLANKSYEKAKNPFQTGVVPMPSYSDMFMQT